MQLAFDPADMLDPAGVGAVGEDGRPSPPERLSPSGAATFEQCPRRWRFRYVDRLPDPPGVDALVGTFAHRVLEHLMERHPSRRTQADARRIARALWPEVAGGEDYRDLELDDEQAKDFRWKAWRAIEGLWHLEDPACVDVRATEQQVSVTLDGVPFRGVVDRVESEPDGLVISDYKSGRAPSARYAPSRLQQVLLYAAAIAADTGEQPVRAQLLYLGQRIVSTAVTPDELGGAIEQLKSTWGAIADACDGDDFSARPGPLCGYCPYTDRCPEGEAENQRREEERAAEEECLVKLAG